MEAVH